VPPTWQYNTGAPCQADGFCRGAQLTVSYSSIRIILYFRCSILANSAYVSLLLDDYTMALQFSESLLAQDHLSAAHK